MIVGVLLAASVGRSCLNNCQLRRCLIQHEGREEHEDIEKKGIGVFCLTADFTDYTDFGLVLL